MIYILSRSFISFFSAVGYKHFHFLLNSISLFIESKFKREKAARSPEQRLRKHEYISEVTNLLFLLPLNKLVATVSLIKNLLEVSHLQQKWNQNCLCSSYSHNMSVLLFLPLPEFIFLHSIYKQLYKGLLVFLPQLDCKFLESKGFILFTATLPSA